MELWASVIGWPNYMVSNLGRIQSNFSHHGRKGRILSPFPDSQGYLLVGLWLNRKRNNRLVHRLVAAAFLGPSNLEVNHKNGIKIDNRLENLEYCTRSENAIHAVRSGLMKHRGYPGSLNGRAKLTEADVIFIRRSEESNVALAKKLGVSDCAISWARSGRTWAHVRDSDFDR